MSCCLSCSNSKCRSIECDCWCLACKQLVGSVILRLAQVAAGTTRTLLLTQQAIRCGRRQSASSAQL